MEREQASPELPGAAGEVFVPVPGVEYVSGWEEMEALLGALRALMGSHGYGWLMSRARVRVMADGECLLDLGSLHPHAERQWKRIAARMVELGVTWERVA